MDDANRDAESSVEAMDCDVCILGAGIGGLNAAFVAAGHLSRGQKVILIDRHDRAGGMWHEAYPYVRLHQPHPLFTVGNIKWTLGQQRDYLATGDEVIAHLNHCLDVISERVTVERCWGWEYVDHAESGGKVHIKARDREGRTRLVRADRFIKGVGAEIEVNDPLPTSSPQVRSVSPHHLDAWGRLPSGLDGDSPVWVIGSGKTAMDTVHRLVTANGRREVHLVAGSGTYFMNRDRLYPTGRRRWLGGRLPNAVFAEFTRQFDGTNGDAVREWYVQRYGTSAVDDPVHNLFGILSEAETAVIRAGITEVVRDHFEDVVDEAGQPMLMLRSGDRREVAPGSWIVNCTGHFNPRDRQQEPYASASGSVVSINSSAVTLLFPAFAGYFLTHLLFYGKLTQAPLYSVDIDELQRKAKPAFLPVVAALLMYNLSVLFDELPAKVFVDCGLVPEKWYPLPRQLAGGIGFMRAHRRDREHHRKTLDTVHERFGVSCGPLTRS